MGENGEQRIFKYSISHTDIRISLLFGCCISNPSAMMRNAFRKKYGLRYNHAYVPAEDYEYWMRVIKQFKMKSLEDYLYCYRLHGDSLTFKHTSENAASVARRAFEKHVTLRLRIRYHLMVYRKSLFKLLRT